MSPKEIATFAIKTKRHTEKTKKELIRLIESYGEECVLNYAKQTIRIDASIFHTFTPSELNSKVCKCGKSSGNIIHSKRHF